MPSASLWETTLSRDSGPPTGRLYRKGVYSGGWPSEFRGQRLVWRIRQRFQTKEYRSHACRANQSRCCESPLHTAALEAAAKEHGGAEREHKGAMKKQGRAVREQGKAEGEYIDEIGFSGRTKQRSLNQGPITYWLGSGETIYIYSFPEPRPTRNR